MTQVFTRSRFESEAGRLRPMLLRVAVSITGNEEDSADVVQETLLKLWFLRDRLHEYESVEAPARVIVRNLSLNLVRHRALSPIDTGVLPETGAYDREESLSDEMTEALARLPDTEQAVLRMKHLEGFETEEIAEMIHSTPGAVRTAWSRARRRIREYYNPSN